MAAYVLDSVELLAGGLELGCFANQVGVTVTGTEVDATTFCSGSWTTPIIGLRSSSWTASGPTDMATATAAQRSAVDEILAVSLGSTYTLSAVPIGSAEGNVAYFSEGVLMQRDPLGGSVGELATHQVTFTGQNKTVRGVLATEQTVTATGTGTAHNLGAVSADQRIYAAVHLLTAGGTTPSITVKVQSATSSAFTTPNDRITFAAASAKGGQFGSAAGAVTNTWWRAQWTVSGTSPSFQLRVCLGIA